MRDDTVSMALSNLPLQEIYPNKDQRARSLQKTHEFSDVEVNDLEDEDFILYGRHTHAIIIDEANQRFKDAWEIYKDRKRYPTYTTLDSLLPEPYLLAGCLTLLHTPDKPGRMYIIQLFISLMLRYYDQGVVFIDCTNVFPAYELIEATLGMYPLLDPQLPIRAVQLSRSFNYHQTTETVKEYLEPLLRDGFSYNTTDALATTQEKAFVKPKIVIVAGLPDLYLNAESAQYLTYDKRPEWWSILELQETIGYLRSLTLKYNCITIVSASTAQLSHTKALGGKYLNQTSTIVAKLATEGMAIYGELIKHPFATNSEVLLQILKKKGKKRATLPLKLFF